MVPSRSWKNCTLLRLWVLADAVVFITFSTSRHGRFLTPSLLFCCFVFFVLANHPGRDNSKRTIIALENGQVVSKKQTAQQYKAKPLPPNLFNRNDLPCSLLLTLRLLRRHTVQSAEPCDHANTSNHPLTDGRESKLEHSILSQSREKELLDYIFLRLNLHKGRERPHVVDTHASGEIPLFPVLPRLPLVPLVGESSVRAKQPLVVIRCT